MSAPEIAYLSVAASAVACFPLRLTNEAFQSTLLSFSL